MVLSVGGIYDVLILTYKRLVHFLLTVRSSGNAVELCFRQLSVWKSLICMQEGLQERHRFHWTEPQTLHGVPVQVRIAYRAEEGKS